MDLHKVIAKVMPHFHETRSEVHRLRYENPGKTPEELSRLYINKIRNKYASVGAVPALPGSIPGLGTAAQIAVEAGAISADVSLMLRYMAGLCYATALIYGRDIEKEFEDEFTLVLGIWSGIIVPKKQQMQKAKN